MFSKDAPEERAHDTRLPRCAALAGAALAVPLTAHAAIIYSGPQNITKTSDSSNGDQTYPLNLGNGTDFTFTASFNDGTVTVTPGIYDAYLGTDSGPNLATPLAFGTPINGSSMSWLTSQGKIQKTLCIKTCEVKGPWPTDGSLAYLGVQFTLSGELHYGWVGVEALTPDDPTSTFTLTSWAFESTPNATIDAGDTGVAAAPEPSSLALLALGAAGVATLRARRKAA